MKTIHLVFALCFIVTTISAQNINPAYDSVLAKSLGADELGMKTYVLVILKTGSAEIKDSAVRSQLFRGHFANINKLSREGKMLTAGPIDSNEQQFRGIFLLNVTEVSEATELLKGDPTVEQKIFEPLYFLLYGSAAFQEIPEIHSKIQKMNLE
ncbi:MAG TPA: YciI family protein [Bacteroidales bacterium]|jgi:uncharacterized protein YciI|nr:YciI family protein [Bacteroidales bacterium]